MTDTDTIAADDEAAEVAQLREQIEAARVRTSKATRRASQLEGDIRESDLDRAIEREARDTFADPTIAPRVVDRDRIGFDPDTGKFTGVGEAIERVLRAYPGLEASKKGGGSPAAMKTRRVAGATAPGGDILPPGFLGRFILAGNYEKM